VSTFWCYGTRKYSRGRRPTIPRHHADAGGAPRSILTAKQELRERIWATVSERKHARFPGARGRSVDVDRIGAPARLPGREGHGELAVDPLLDRPARDPERLGDAGLGPARSPRRPSLD
jgi:hypothetical protein